MGGGGRGGQQYIPLKNQQQFRPEYKISQKIQG